MKTRRSGAYAMLWVISLFAGAGVRAQLVPPIPPPRPLPLPLPQPRPLPQPGPQADAPDALTVRDCRKGGTPIACDAIFSCAALSPSGGDDAKVITGCMKKCNCVLLPAGDYLISQPIDIETKKKLRDPAHCSTYGDCCGGDGTTPCDFTGARLVGAGHGVTRIVPQPGCPAPTAKSPFVVDGAFQSPIHLVRVAQAFVSGFSLDVRGFKQSCNKFGYGGAYSVLVSDSPMVQLQDIEISGALPDGSARDPGGSDMGGIDVVGSPNATVQGNDIHDLGWAYSNDPKGTCTTSSGFTAIEVSDSAASVIRDNHTTHTAFGVAVIGSSSGSQVLNNTIVGASSLHCECGRLNGSSQCEDPNDRFHIRCSQGRAIRLGLEGTTVAVSNVVVDHNVISEASGRERAADGSGFGSELDLSGNVQQAMITNNIFDGRCTGVPWGLNVRMAVTAASNVFRGNVFYADEKVTPRYYDVRFETASVPDQSGLGRSSNQGMNRYRDFGVGNQPTTTATPLPANSTTPNPPSPAAFCTRQTNTSKACSCGKLPACVTSGG